MATRASSAGLRAAWASFLLVTGAYARAIYRPRSRYAGTPGNSQYVIVAKDKTALRVFDTGAQRQARLQQEGARLGQGKRRLVAELVGGDWAGWLGRFFAARAETGPADCTEIVVPEPAIKDVGRMGRLSRLLTVYTLITLRNACMW